MIIFVFLLPFIALGVQACPQSVAAICRCEDLHNGVSLNCSDSDGAVVLETLKANQALLGLIQNLVLHRANIRAVPASFFAGLYIKRLDLSHNRLVKLDSNAFAGMSPVLQELSLTHNNLTEIPTAALKEVKTLLKLDLSNNTIGDLSAEQAIPPLPKLFDLNLAYNNICSVHKNALAGIRDNVQTINFGHNCLSAVPAPAIRGFKQLMALHMHHNDISTLDALSFMNLPVMNLLNLASNKITEVKAQAFLNVPNLRYLYLTSNHIATIAAHQFSAFEQLEMLDLTNNFIDTLPTAAFTGLGQLKQLYLGNNRIATIQPDAFANSSIAILILASNNMTSLEEGSLNGLPNLQQISFKDNHISSMHQNAFYNTASVAMVDLSGNALTELPASVFLTQLNLLLIDLSRNKIAKTPYSAFNRRIGTVLLQENPLVCTEKVHMLQDGVGVYVPNSEDFICGGKPKPSTPRPTTTTPQAAAFPQDIVIAKTSEDVEEVRGDTELNIRQLGTPQRIKFGESGVPVFEPSAPGMQLPMQHLPDPTRPSILNVRPTNIVTRTRSHFGSELSGIGPTMGRLPSRENPYARTAVHVPANSISTTLPAKVEDPTMIAQPAPMPLEELPPHIPIPDVEDEALAKVLSAIPLPPTTTVEPLPRPVTDIADNPHRIFPFPVPFLKRGPNLASSIRITPSTTTDPSVDVAQQQILHEPEVHTLPPSIVLAPRPRPVLHPDTDANRIDTDRFQEFPLRAEPDEVSSSTGSSRRSGITPATIVAICLTSVGVAMVAVFAGLCVKRHVALRSMGIGSSSSDSSTARTNASMSISRPEEAQQPWIYSPSNYCTYYK